MAEHNKNIHNNTISEVNSNNFWLTCPPPPLTTTQSMTPAYNLDYRPPFVYPYMPSCNKPEEINPISLPYNYNINNVNYQDQYLHLNQSMNNSFSFLSENIDEEYILKYLCPKQKVLKDETNLWIENWLATKEKQITMKMDVTSSNKEINEISNRVKECKILLEKMNNNKQIMEQNILIMSETEWEKACENFFTAKEQINTSLKTFNLDDNFISELKLKLSKRKKKRDRLKRLKSNLKIIKSQQKDEIIEINRKINTWQNTLKEKILKEKRVTKTKIEANIVLKGVRGKIDDAKNQLSLLDTLEKLRRCRLQNCVNKRKNPQLEESLNKLKILWHKKLMDYNKEEDELKIMLSKAEAKKHEKRENEIQEKLIAWDQIIFGPDFKSHDIVFDNLHTFLDIRKDWDEHVVDNETLASSSIPVGWILPTVPCNSDWASYSNYVNKS